MVAHRTAPDQGFPQAPERSRFGFPRGAAYHPSMLLAIDVGNTTVAATLVRDGAPGPARRTPTAAGGRPGAAAALRDALLAGLAAEGVRTADLAGIALASVVPTVTRTLGVIAAELGLPLLVADHTTVPIPIRVDRPETVGADRLVDAYAAGRLHGRPAVVVDLGTATTIEAVGPDGAYLGGAIAPGIELGLEALASRTALLPRVDVALPAHAIATETVGAIQAGTVLGHRELVAGLVRLVRAELAATTGIAPAAIPAVATGGLSAAPWVATIEGIDLVDPDLLVRGLAALWDEMGPPARSDTRAGAEARR